ncbi:MAG: hypothetical protein JSV67_02400 [Thermoplasmatales archaeon]|nr:MAG: hypothetical protein JSV67_02400 [Thermoplasmatales archaeon]
MKEKMILILIVGILALGGFGASAFKVDSEDIRNIDIKEKCLLNNINGQSGLQEEWNKTFGGRFFDHILDGKKTNDGFYIVCGSTRSFDNENGENEDGWLLKTDTYGNEIWNKTYDKMEEDVLARVHQTSDNGYILNGWIISSDGKYHDSWIIKTDEYGVEIWNNTFGGIYIDYSYSNIVETSDDGYLLSGFSNSYGDFDGDLWVLKIDGNGNEEWNKTFGGAKRDYGVDIINAHDGGYIILGNTFSYGEGDSDCWIIKIDDNGNEQWSKTFGDNFYNNVRRIRKTGDGGYIVVGTSFYVIDAEFDYFYLDFDIWVFKIDLLGNLKWETTIGDRFVEEFANSIQPSSDSGFLISGMMIDKSNGKTDGLLMKIDGNGCVEWKNIFGGLKHEDTFKVIQTENDDYVVFGYTNSYGEGDYDAWIIKFSYFENERPHTPNKPIGPLAGRIMDYCDYSCIGTEPEGQEIYYLFNWGDGYDSGWLGPYDSGESCIATYFWSDQGDYEIRVKIKDVHGGESDWSDPLSVRMPRNMVLKNFVLLRFIDRLGESFPLMKYIIKILEE